MNSLNEYAIKYHLPSKTIGKVKGYLENKSKSTISDGKWEALFAELPSALQADVVKETHGKLIEKFLFLHGKPTGFLMSIVPKM